MDAEEALIKLKKDYPEIDEGILLEALRNNDYDYRRANEAIRVRRSTPCLLNCSLALPSPHHPALPFPTDTIL